MKGICTNPFPIVISVIKGLLRTVCLLIFTFVCSNASSQFNETIRSGRPGQSIGAFTVGKKIFQVQSGIDFFGSKEKKTDFKNTGYLCNTVVRFGLTEPFEVSTVFEYRSEETTLVNNRTSLSGWSAVDIGMRFHIYTGTGLMPNIGFQIRGRLPMGGDYKVDRLAPRFIFVTSQSLSEKFTLITNWGASWSGNDGIPKGNYTVNLSCALTSRFGIFIENYGSVYQSDFDTNLDGGLAFLVNHDLQLDLLSGYGSNDRLKEFFISMGISWRTKRKST